MHMVWLDLNGGATPTPTLRQQTATVTPARTPDLRRRGRWRAGAAPTRHTHAPNASSGSDGHAYGNADRTLTPTITRTPTITPTAAGNGDANGDEDANATITPDRTPTDVMTGRPRRDGCHAQRLQCAMV